MNKLAIPKNQNKISLAVALAVLSIGSSSYAGDPVIEDDNVSTTLTNTTTRTTQLGYETTNTIDNDNDGELDTPITIDGTSYLFIQPGSSIANLPDYDGLSGQENAIGYTSTDQNTLNNSGSITVSGGSGIGIRLTSDANQTHNADGRILITSAGRLTSSNNSSIHTYSYAESLSNVDDNTIINSGTVSASIGIQLQSTTTAVSDANALIWAWSNNDGYDPDEDGVNEQIITGNYNADATSKSYAMSYVDDNSITNSGDISANDFGIRLRSYSTATAEATRREIQAVGRDYYGVEGYGRNPNYFVDYDSDESGPLEGTYYSQTRSDIKGNSLLNSGDIVVADGAGIVLDAVTLGDVSSSYAADFVSAVGGFARTYVYDNTITNNRYGIISADDDGSGSNISDGIGLYATTQNNVAEGYVDNDAFVAIVDANTITNSGRIYGMRDGIRISAYNDSYDNVAGAQVTNNVINNNYVGWDDDAHTEEGRIVSNQKGIYIFAQTNDGEDTPATVNGNTINNSSLIVSDPGMSLDGTSLAKSDPANFVNTNPDFVAIELNGQGDNGNTLNLNNPAYLAGTILLSEGSGVDSNTTVNLTSGYSHSNVWSIQNDGIYGPADVNLLGQLPWFVRESTVGVNAETNNTYATYDPSMLAARANAAADLSEAANVAIATNMTRDLKAPSQLWMTGSYGNNRYDQRESNPNMDQKTRLYTVAVGYDQTVDNYRVGVMAGYNQSRLTTGSLYSDLYAHSYDNESSGGFASLYGMRDLGMFKLDLGLSAGAQEHDDKRFVNDNLEWWGISYAKSNYNSQWVSPSAKLALPFDLGSDWTVAPNAQVSYTYQRIGSYTEKESNSNASFDSYGIGVVESRLAVDLSKDVGGLKATLTGGYMNRDVKSGNSIDMTMIGHKQQVDSWTQNLDAVFARLSLKYDITDKFAINAMGSYMKAKHQGSDDGTSGGYGNLSLIYKF